MRINAFARGAGLAIVFAAVMAFAFAAETSECEAADTVTDGLTIRCGTGHEEMAEKLTTVMNEIEVSALDYQKISARRWNTNVYVSYPDTVTIGQMRNAVTSYLESISSHTIIENDELLWRTEIGLYPVEHYNSFDEYWKNSESHKDDLLSTWYDFYLLWRKPFDQDFAVTIDTPVCGSTAPPSVTSETVPLATNYFSVHPEIDPVWFEQKPEHPEFDYPVLYESDLIFYRYKGALKGGTPYYACAELNHPWGYYFPKVYTKHVTVNGKPADALCRP